MHFKKTHEKKVNKLEKKLSKKANGSYKSGKKKLTMAQFKATIVLKKDKFKLLIPKY